MKQQANQTGEGQFRIMHYTCTTQPPHTNTPRTCATTNTKLYIPTDSTHLGVCVNHCHDRYDTSASS
jgi:hypothetical protein